MSLLIANSLDNDMRKVFIDGVSTGEKINPYYLKAVRAYTNEQTTLEVIANAIQTIEKKDLNCCLLPNRPRYTVEGGKFRRTKEMLHNEPRNWVQLDLDWRVPGGDFNQYNLDERVNYALRALPFFSCAHRLNVASTGMVAHLSNKAGVEAYKEYIGLRLYVMLSEALTAVELRNLLAPWHGTSKVGTVDSSLANFNAIHLVRTPKLVNTRRDLQETVKVYQGAPLDVNSLREHEDSKGYKHTARKFERTIRIGQLGEDEKQELIEIAKDGFFENRRNEQHFKMIASAIYTKQNASPIIKFISETPEILGERRTIDDLVAQEANVHERNREQYIPELWNQTDVYSHEDLDILDVNNANLDAVFDRLNLFERSVIVCKSPHGSGKTNALVPRIEKYVKERYGLEHVRTLYICSLRSVIRQTTTNLMMACYITPDGKIDDLIIEEADRIGICVKSLARVESNKAYDVVVIDESEQVAMWSDWENQTHNMLVDVCSHAKVALLMDADAADLSMYMAREISREGEHELAVLFNTKSYIASQKAFLLQYEVDFYGKILDLLDEGKSIWINVDFDDKNSNPRITALVKLIDGLYGEGTALGYDSKHRKAPLEFFTEPDAFIENAFKKGVRVIITSPVISVGWRYKGLPRFDATVSSYAAGIQSAPAIIQQLERCVAVNSHYLYIAPNSTYLDLDELEAKYNQEYFERNSNERAETIVFKKDFRDRLKIISAKRKTLELNNIRLHFYYLWESFGGSIIELSSVYQEDKDALDALQKYKKLKEEELEQRCKELYDNSDARAAFFYNYRKKDSEHNFVEIDEITSHDIDYQSFLKLFKKHDKVMISQSEITEFVHLMTTKEKDHVSWSFFAPWWLNEQSTNKDTKVNERFYVPIGQLVHGMMRLILQDDTLDIHRMREKLLQGNEEIVLHAKELNDKKISELRNNYGDVFTTRLKYYRANMTNVALVRHILTDILSMKVNTVEGRIEYENPYQNTSLPNIKKLLIQSYMDEGKLKKSKNLRPMNNIQTVEKAITKKELERAELSDLELAYLDKSDYLIIATRESFIPKKLHSLLDENTRKALF